MVSASSDIDEPNPNNAVKARHLPQLATMEAQEQQRRQLWITAWAVRLLIGDALGDAFRFGIESQDAIWCRTRANRTRANPCHTRANPCRTRANPCHTRANPCHTRANPRRTRANA